MKIYKVTSEHGMMVAETREVKYFRTMDKANRWIQEREEKWTGKNCWTGKEFTYEHHKVETIEVED